LNHPLIPVKNRVTRPSSRTAHLVLVSGSAISIAALMGGCEWDSYLRTNVVGRWENTATKVPILTRIAAIEDENALDVDSVAPTPEDLYPDPREYRIGPGDELDLEIYDIVETGLMTPYTRKVDVRGMINIPQLGDVFVNGKTVDGVRDAIATSMKKLVDQPLVGVNVKAERQQTFVIQGAVDQPGPYFIPSPDYKLLEALTAGGRMPSSVQDVYIIRQVPLDERVERATTPPMPAPKKGGSPFDTPAGQEQSPGTNEPGLMDILKDLSKPKEGAPAPAPDAPAPTPPPMDEPKPMTPPPGDAPIDLPPSPTQVPPAMAAPVKPTPTNPSPQPAPAPEKPAEKPPEKAPDQAEPPIPLPGMMASMAPPESEEARQRRMRALEAKLKRPASEPLSPRSPGSGTGQGTSPTGGSPSDAGAAEMTPPTELPTQVMPRGSGPMTVPQLTPGATRPSLQPARPTGPEAAVDLPESSKPRKATPAPTAARASTSGKTSWVYLNGRWVQVRRPGTSGTEGDALLGGDEPIGLGAVATGPLFAQKVIKVSLEALFRGDSSANIVIRPGDVVRVPPPPEGEVYVAGQVLRPGSYQLSQAGGAFTVTRAIVAAGGLGDEAIPERVDLVRVVGNNQQAMMRIDLRAMYEGTQPDILLKKDDMINIGSNFWAFPLAVLRNGFRTNYGFGFLLDRNFGSDVFGVPPESRARGGF